MGININGSIDLISATDGGLDITGLTRLVGVSTAGITTAYIGSINDGPISGARNRIINGDMRIDQRNAGASVTALDAYAVDRWQYEGSQTSKFTLQQNAGSVTPPAGFVNYYGATSSSAYSVTASDFFLIGQRIEGFNVDDLAWGTANAKTVTLSFWVRSSLTGTFGGAFTNSASNRSYPFSYSISSANTWEQKSITVAGDTSGTWVTNNGLGIRLRFSLGAGSTFSGTAGSWAAANYVSATGATSVVGTNGATFYITGVQLEAGSVATPFERRSYGQELALCQRYYYKIGADGGASNYFTQGQTYNTQTLISFVYFPVTMRAAPSSLGQSGTATDYRITANNNTFTCNAVPTLGETTPFMAIFNATIATASLLQGGSGFLRANTGANGFIAFSAEL